MKLKPSSHLLITKKNFSKSFVGGGGGVSIVVVPVGPRAYLFHVRSVLQVKLDTLTDVGILITDV